MYTLQPLHLLFPILLLTISSIVRSTEANPISPKIEFIHSNCKSTLYPDLCFNSLSPYAATINQIPLKLSQTAMFFSLSHIQSVTSHVSALSIPTTLLSNSEGQMLVKSLKDCTQVLGDAIDRTKDSMAELKKLKGAINETEVRWFVANVQTWMSAVLTNEETCSDGLKERGGSKISTVMVDVGGRVGVAKEFTSNALALINKLPYGR